MIPELAFISIGTVALLALRLLRRRVLADEAIQADWQPLPASASAHSA